MSKPRLFFEGKPVYIYKFPDCECAHFLWTTKEIEQEELIKIFVELNNQYEEWKIKSDEEIYDAEKQEMVPNTKYDESFPFPCWEKLLKEKYGMEKFDIDYTYFVPDSIISGPDYENKLRKIQNIEQEKADDLSNRNE